MPYQPDSRYTVERPYWRSGQTSTPQNEHIWVAYAGDVTLEVGTGKPLQEPEAKFWTPTRLFVDGINIRPAYPVFVDGVEPESTSDSEAKPWFPPVPVPPAKD